MIIVKLSEILGRKKIKISDVMKSTGVTRPTLTSLYYGNSRGINFDTLDSICRYLSITPGELLRFVNLDIAKIKIDFKADRFEDNYAVFSGFVSFAFPKRFVLVVSGDLSGNDLNLTLFIDKNDFDSIFDDESQDLILEFLKNEILNEYEKYSDVPDIYSIFVNFTAPDQNGSDTPAE